MKKENSLTDKTSNSANDYINPEETTTESNEEEIAVKPEEDKYGINKPKRITIKAIISHD